MNIFIMQHLPVENNERGIVTGLTDQPVSRAGKYLLDLQKNVHSLCFQAALCSPLMRSTQTIEMCFGKNRLKTIIDVRLLPVNYGEWHQKKKCEVAEKSHLYVDKPFPRGESFSDMANRYRDFFADIKKTHDENNLLLIAHEGTEAVLKHICYGISLYQVIKQAGECFLYNKRSPPGSKIIIEKEPTA